MGQVPTMPTDAPVDTLVTSVVIYVLHHPRSEEGRRLAGLIHQWFRRPTPEVWRARCGVPVYVRSHPFEGRHELSGAPETLRTGAPDAEDPIARQPLAVRTFACANERGALTFVVPLVDGHLVTDARWRNLIRQLMGELDDPKDPMLLTPERLASAPAKRAQGRPYVQVVPVSLDAYASQVAPALGEQQGINPAQWGDPADADDARAVRDARLRRELYLVTIRTLRWLLTGRPSDEPVQVFLSHAKRDGEHGAGVAEALRNLTSGLGHLRAWYDATDLLPGTRWETSLAENAGAATAGLIACWSDSYSSRPWCLEELRLARTPRALPVGKGENAGKRLWIVQPTAVVDLTGSSGAWTSAPPELGGLPVIRWAGNQVDAAPVDHVLFQSFQTLANAIYARRLLERDPAAHAVTWAPDPATMLALVRAWKDDRPPRLLHPGYDAHGQTAGVSGRIAPPGVELISYEEARARAAPRTPSAPPAEAPGAGGAPAQTAQGRRVQLSMGDPGDAAAMGFLPHHMDDLAYEAALALLGAGANILYGGQPREHRPGEPTQLVEEIAMAALEVERPDRAQPHEPRERVLFLVPWNGPLTPALRTRWLPVCKLLSVLPPRSAADLHEAAPESDELAWLDELEADEPNLRRNHALAISAMRHRAAALADLVVLGGGKSKGFHGVMPSLLEEFMEAHEAGKPTVILAAFGGTAREIAQRILDPKGAVPAGLLPDTDARRSPHAELHANLARRKEDSWARGRWDRAIQVLSRVEGAWEEPGRRWVSHTAPRVVITTTESFREVRACILAEAAGP